MAFSLKKLQQHSRRQAAARRSSTTVAHPPILRNAGHLLNNLRNVGFSATCTTKLYDRDDSPSLSVAIFEETEERMLSHVEEVAQPEEERKKACNSVMTLVMSQLNRLRGAQGCGHQGGAR